MIAKFKARPGAERSQQPNPQTVSAPTQDGPVVREGRTWLASVLTRNITVKRAGNVTQPPLESAFQAQAWNAS